MSAPPVTNREREYMRRERAKGRSLEDIGAELGRSGRCVGTHVGDLGIRCRSGLKGLGEDGKARLLRAAADQVPHEEIAARFGFKVTSVAPTISRLRRERRLAAASQNEARA